MDIQVQKRKNDYIMRIRYEANVKIGQVYELIGTNGGFSKWFPELRIETEDGKELLIFEMADFREEMKILSRQRDKAISYEWDRAVVKFELFDQGASTRIEFEEVIPSDFGNEFSDAAKDMTGWYVQNRCISELLETGALPDRIEALKADCLAFISERIDRLGAGDGVK